MDTLHATIDRHLSPIVRLNSRQTLAKGDGEYRVAEMAVGCYAPRF